MSAIPRIVLAAFVTAAALSARAEAPRPMQAGADVGFLFRDEAGGNRSVLPTLAPRFSLGLAPHVNAVGAYSFAYAPAGDLVASAGTQHHRFATRAEYWRPLGTARLVAGLGPALALMHTNLYDSGDAKVSATVLRLGVSALGALEVELPEVTLRSGVEAVFTRARADVVVSLGASFRIGGGR